jgi:hypothetical protein
VSVNVTPAARDALQQVTLRASAAVGKRLSMSRVLVAAMAVIDAHENELHAAITTDPIGADE